MVIEWSYVSPFVSILLAVFLPWILTRKIHQDMEPMLEKALDRAIKDRPDSESVRKAIQEAVKFTEESVRREYATKESMARLEERLDSLASKEAVMRLSTQIENVMTLLEKLDKRLANYTSKDSRD